MLAWLLKIESLPLNGQSINIDIMYHKFRHALVLVKYCDLKFLQTKKNNF